MKRISILVLTITSVLLTACASSELEAPCPDFGRYCKRQPINSWDYYDNNNRSYK